METLWFCIVAVMLAVYVTLDGFDLGAGIVHLIVARNNNERRIVLNAIGPVWDGNEVWLLASGGVLYFAFPMLYASAFSGFYLPLMIVLWLLMLRAAGIELRHQIHHGLWEGFWDASFAGASILLTIFFGAALGNVVRGVPLNAEGYFFEPLWTTFTVVPEAGILDWFTVIMGLVAFFTLATHGGNYLAMKTDGDLRSRARSAAGIGLIGLIVTSITAFLGTLIVRPDIWANYTRHPWGLVFPLGGVLGLAGMFLYRIRENDTRAFLASALFIISMLAATAFALYPVLLPASTDPAWSITIYNAAAGSYGLTVGLVWWIVGIGLAGIYFIYVYRKFRGKVVLPEHGEGY